MDVRGMEETRTRLAEIIDRVQAENVPTLITRHGRPAAVIISISMWQSTAETDSVALAMVSSAVKQESEGAVTTVTHGTK